MSNSILNITWLPLLLIAVNSAQANPAVKHLLTYQQHGVTRADAIKGKQLWYTRNNQRSCSSCHGDNPGKMGQHVKTRKTIKPMAFSINPERYQDSKKIEKWFLRNCKWTFDRKCTAQEKADILTWLSSQ